MFLLSVSMRGCCGVRALSPFWSPKEQAGHIPCPWSFSALLQPRLCIPRELPAPRGQLQVLLWAQPKGARGVPAPAWALPALEAFPWGGIPGELWEYPARAALCSVPPSAGWVQPGWVFFLFFGVALFCIFKPARRNTKSTPGAVQDTLQRLNFCCSKKGQHPVRPAREVRAVDLWPCLSKSNRNFPK